MTVPRNDLTPPRPHPDPTRHVLIYPAYDRQPDGTVTVRPIALDEAATEWRAVVEAAATAEPSAKQQPPNGVVVISPGRASVIAALVRELSKRLQPGLAVGPIQSDGSISRLAKDLADDLNRRAWA
jgi:hypothetical protein